MSTTLREVLARRANDSGLPDLDIDELVGLGERRLRRRRLAAVLGSAAAVVLVIALALVVGAGLNGSVKRSDGLTDRPTSSPEAPLPLPVRKIVYSDGSPTQTHSTIHIGARAVEVDNGPVHIDVTDDGIVYATGHGRLWFSDGGTPAKIASHACGSFSFYDRNSVVTANAGSVVAWFDCTVATRPALVVFDTDSGREVFREPMAFCRPIQERLVDEWCGLQAVIGEHVYFNRHFGRDGFRNPVPPTDRLFSFDLTTGRRSAATSQSYAEDIRSHSRALVIGNTLQTGTPTNGIGQRFKAVGSRLFPQQRIRNGGEAAAMSFDTATGRAVRLRLPAGYRTQGLVLFEWLDDNTVALVGGTGRHSFDIVTCRLSDGRCDLAVKATRGMGVVPQLALPG